MRINVKSQCYVVTENGEIINALEEGSIINVTTKQQINSMKEKQQKEAYERVYNLGGRPFGILDEAAATKISRENLGSADLRVMIYCMAQSNFKSGLIAHKNNKPMSASSIAKGVGLGNSTTYRALKKLEARSILASRKEAGVIKYYFNPFILRKGSWINRNVYEMFKETEWAKLCE